VTVRVVAGSTPDLLADTWLGAATRRYPTAAPTIVHNLARGRRLHADRPLVVDEADDGTATTTTYAQFADLVEGAAAELAEQGLRPGARVAVALPNGLDIAVAIWACARAGFVFVGLSTKLPPAQWRALLEHSGASAAFAAPEHLDALADAGSGLDVRVEPVTDLFSGRPRPWRDHAPLPAEDATYAIIYSSGTTGRPKAVRMVHRCVMQAAEHYVRALSLIETDRTAVTFPFYYLSGHVTQLNPAMLSGGSVVPVRTSRPSAVVELLERHGVTWLDVVPSLLGLLTRVDGFAWPALGHLRLAVYGGSPMLSGVVDRMRARMPQTRLVDTYGLTETSVAFCCAVDGELDRRPGSVGRPIPIADLRVVDGDGRDVPVGEPGELWVRGPFVTPGYDGDDEATAAAITDGWFHTGDVGRIDDEGYVFVLDRVADTINRGGLKVFSAEVERVLTTRPEVAEAAVFGVPDRLGGEAVAAVVVAAPGATVDADELRLHVRRQLADYAAPRWLRVVDALPRNRTGKVDKVALRNSVPGPRGS
jgi:acyl-CoA synthetase (AMP-forming)/AMP-acid ligase II